MKKVIKCSRCSWIDLEENMIDFCGEMIICEECYKDKLSTRISKEKNKETREFFRRQGTHTLFDEGKK